MLQSPARNHERRRGRPGRGAGSGGGKSRENRQAPKKACWRGCKASQAVAASMPMLCCHQLDLDDENGSETKDGALGFGLEPQ